MSDKVINPSKSISRWTSLTGNGLIWILVIGGLILLLYTYYRPITAGKNEKKEYTGRIVDKFTTSSEWYTGSTFSRYLELEEKTGVHRRLKVSEEMYQKAEPGMWIEVNESGVRLYRPENQIGISDN